MELLSVKDLHIHFSLGERVCRAVEGVSFNLSPGETLGLVGESGCGKTTTALSLMGLLPKNGSVRQGKVLYKGRDINAFSEEEMRKFRWKEISIIFQGAMNALNPVLRVGDQIIEAIQVHENISEELARARTRELLDLVEIDRRRASSYPHEFSGGMRQRVMIAMALACNPSIVLGDEPTTALDVMVQAQIFELLEKLRRDLGMAMILITHDLSVLGDTCERVAVMYAGRIVETGTIEEIFSEQHHPYTYLLLRSFPNLSGPRGLPASLGGTPPDLFGEKQGCLFRPRCSWAVESCAKEMPASTIVSASHVYSCHRGKEMPWNRS